jgi:hypothetical protein
MKRVIRLALVLLIVVPLLGCSAGNSNDKASDKAAQNKILIMVGEQDINHTITSRPFTSREDFKKAYLEIDREKPIYVPRGSKITLDLKEQEVIASIKAYWINREGAPNYNDSFGAPLDMDIEVKEIGDSEYEFTVERLLQASLSSYYEENEKITAGYVAELQKNDETRYCFFIIQIDKN